MSFKELRKKKFPKQQDFAKAMNENVSTVSNWESGISAPHISKIQEIAKVLDTSIESVAICFAK
jgi:transcriptional regulator with XRE-family HTH domain